MKVNFLEPLGIPQQKLENIVKSILGDSVEATFYDSRSEDPEVLIERGRGADCVVLSNIKFGRDIISKLPNLKAIDVAFTGVDLIDLDYCKERNIKVSNCAGYSTAAVADLVFGLVIDIARNVIQYNQDIRNNGTKGSYVGIELEGKKFGVIGAGAIGTRVLKIAQAFGCDTYAFSRTKKNIPGVTFTTLEDLCAICDIISVHVPQNSSTIGMIGKDQFALMKKSTIFINCARGPIVDSNALAEALNEGKIFGAGIDVFDNEPPLDKNNILLNAKNLIATPHIAFVSEQAFEKRAVIVCNNIKGWLDNKPINVIC